MNLPAGLPLSEVQPPPATIVRSGASYGEGAAQRSDGMGGANIADALAVACALDRRVVTVRRTPPS